MEGIRVCPLKSLRSNNNITTFVADDQLGWSDPNIVWRAAWGGGIPPILRG